MLINKRKTFLAIALLLVSSGIFASPGSSASNPFTVKKAFYQSWVISENEKGTNVVLELTRIRKGVTFDSIIFRGVRMKALVSATKRGAEIKSILPSGKSRIKITIEVVNLPDQLIYHQEGERKVFFLKDLKRKNTRFY